MEATSASPFAVPVGLLMVIDALWPLRFVEAPLRKAMAASEAAGSSRHATAKRAKPSSIDGRDGDLTGGCKRKPDAEPGYVLRPCFVSLLRLPGVTIRVNRCRSSQPPLRSLIRNRPGSAAASRRRGERR